MTRHCLLLGLLGLLFTAVSPAFAADGEIVVAVGQTVSIPAAGFPRHEVIAADKIDVVVRADQLAVTGKETGQATLILWDEQGRHSRYVVKVVPPGQVSGQVERDLRAALAADPLTRDAGVRVEVAGDRATLTGSVPTQAAADRAVALAKARVGDVVSNLQVAGGAPTMTPQPTPVDGGLLPALPAPQPGGDAPPLVELPGTPRVRIDDMQQLKRLELAVGEARLITVPTELHRALIADEAIADVVPIPPREVAIVAKQPGDTTLMVWYKGTDQFLREMENVRLDVHVVGPPTSAEAGRTGPTSAEIDSLMKLLGVSGVTVLTSGEGDDSSVLLAGEVVSAAMRTRAEQGLRALFPEAVRLTNLIEIRPPAMMQPAELKQRAAELEKLIAEQIPNASIRVRTRVDGQRIRVYLSGEAAVPSDRLRAEQLVTFELGEAALITNDIVTPLPPPPNEVLEAAGGEPEPELPPLSQALAEALETSGVRHDRVYLDVFEDRGLAVVRGSVRNDDDREAILEALQPVIDQYDGKYELRDRALGVRQPRVVTEVEIIEMSATDQQNLGLVYGVPLSTQGGTGGGATQGGTQVDNTNGLLTTYGESVVGDPFRRIDAVATSIRALVQENRARVLQQPNITCDDGQQGTVEIVQEVPLPSTTTGTGGTTGTSVEFRPVGIRLQVTPTIIWGDPDDRIEMEIHTEVSSVDFAISVTIAGSSIPSVSNRQATTVVTVNNAESLVLGGLTTETERKNVSKLPFLGDIPLLGALFRYNDTKKEQTSVVIVMTPRIQW